MSGNIYLRRFNAIEDLPYLNEWLVARGLKEAACSELAGVGYIALKEEKEADDLPIAVAFLRRCEGGMGMLDGLCTNPSAPGALRNECINMLVEKILMRAKRYGMRKILSWSVDKGTLERSLNFGFKVSGFTFITKDLGE